jgi:hypothetical protein
MIGGLLQAAAALMSQKELVASGCQDVVARRESHHLHLKLTPLLNSVSLNMVHLKQA